MVVYSYTLKKKKKKKKKRKSHKAKVRALRVGALSLSLNDTIGIRHESHKLNVTSLLPYAPSLACQKLTN